MSDIEKEYQISTGLQDYGLGLEMLSRKAVKKIGHTAVVLVDEYDKAMLDVLELDYYVTVNEGNRIKLEDFDSNDPRESIPDRIVSTSKPYVRPIVRGKDVKSRNFPSTPSMRAQDSDIASRCTSGCLVWMRRR